MIEFSEGFIRDLHTASQDLRAKNRDLNNQLSLYKSQLKKASEKFTELICEYRAEREIPRALIQSIYNILKCEESEG
jgi:DNA anti-recombination protein RmuC